METTQISVKGRVQIKPCQVKVVDILKDHTFALRQHLNRGTYHASWEPYIQSYRFFCIRIAGQPQICSHFLWNRSK